MAISVQNSGSIADVGQTVQIDSTGFAGLGIQAAGTWSGILQFEGSIDGATFASLGATAASALLTAVTSTTSNGIWQASCQGLKLVRVRASAWASGTALITLLVDPAGGAVGSTLMTGGAVTIAQFVASAETLSNVASSATNVTLLAANASRLGCTMFNDSTQAAYVKFGATASLTSFTYKVFPSQTLEFPLPIYRGVVEALWDSANGSMRITEAT